MPAAGDLVHQTSASTGTGNLAVDTVYGKRSFATAFGTGGTNVFVYFASNRAAAEWEIGTGHMSDATTLVRDTVIKSSNADAAVNFSAGVKDITNFVLANKLLVADVEDQGPITGGAGVTVKDLGNLSGQTITPDPRDRPHQKITNNGAGTIAPGTNYGNYLLDVINTTGAGAITTSGWTKVAGDAFTTTTTHKFRCHASITADGSLLSVQALQ